MVCFSIFASEPHLDPITTSENILRRSSIEPIMWATYMDASLVLEGFINRSRIPHIIYCLKHCGPDYGLLSDGLQ